jgi:hypothetical protein
MLETETIDTIALEKKETHREITTEITPNKRQQEKIITALSSGNPDAIFEEQSKIPDEEKNKQREELLQKLANGEIGEGEIENLLLHIALPIENEKDPNNPTEMFGKISNHKYALPMKSFLTKLAINDFTRGNELKPTDLPRLLWRYPDPIIFEKATQGILREMGSKVSPEKYNEFKESLEELSHILYGKGADYYDQIKLLQEEAWKRYGKPENRKNRPTNTDPIETRKKRENYPPPKMERVREEIIKPQIETISKEEAEEIFNKTEIHGDAFMGEYLTPEILKEERLGPRYKTEIEDSVIWFSSAYKLGGGRIAVVAYVKKEGKTIARSYYRSNSQGIWRYLPDYKMGKNGKISWLGKGYGEESVTLPVELQQALSVTTKDDKNILKLKRNSEFILAGTAKIFGEQPGEYYDEVEFSPRRLKGNFYAEHGKTPPEQMILSEDESPNFSKLLTSWEQETILYGKMIIEVFPSKDGSLKYMFCSDSLGRTWIGGIENNSEIQSTGLRKTWIKGGDLTTPAFEYKDSIDDRTGGYGNEAARVGPYVDMHKNYLSKIPVIKEYMSIRSGERNFK